MTIDRKALIRAYKEAPTLMGVGVVRNTTNGRAFLVTGANLPALLNRHRAQLRLGGHPNKALQADWNTLGDTAFTFDVLDTLAPSTAPDADPRADLEALEALWMDKLAPYEPAGYHRPPKHP